jgi:recombination DNA repair RAD52 pathway protein
VFFSGEWYALVDFYSAAQANKARLFTHNQLTINRKCVRVLKNKGGKGKTNLPLSVRKCESLANHFLGFDGWRSQIVYHK